MTQQGQFKDMCVESGEFDDLLEMASKKANEDKRQQN
jgi:hypothetical protein